MMTDQEYVEFMNTPKGKRLNRWKWAAVVAVAGFPEWMLMTVGIVIAVKGA